MFVLNSKKETQNQREEQVTCFADLINKTLYLLIQVFMYLYKLFSIFHRIDYLLHQFPSHHVYMLEHFSLIGK